MIGEHLAQFILSISCLGLCGLCLLVPLLLGSALALLIRFKGDRQALLGLFHRAHKTSSNDQVADN